MFYHFLKVYKVWYLIWGIVPQSWKEQGNKWIVYLLGFSFAILCQLYYNITLLNDKESVIYKLFLF